MNSSISPIAFVATASVVANVVLAGCATLQAGQPVNAVKDNPQLLNACFVPGEPAATGSAVTFVNITTGQFGNSPLFRSAALFPSIEAISGCEVVVKVVKNVVLRNTMRPIELYSARTKKLLDRFEGSNSEGVHNIFSMLSGRLSPGSNLYSLVMAEAPIERRTQAQFVPAGTPALAAAAPASGVTREELKALMAEALMTATQSQPEAATRIQSSDVDKPRYRKPVDARKYAVVVGVEKYADLPEARFAERDAHAVYDHLVALGYPPRNIAFLRGAQATRTGLVKNLEAWLPQNVGPDSTVFFYYSGHGAPDLKAAAAYLIPADGDPNYLEETAYPLKRLYEKLGALKARRVLVAMDSCFSGAGGRSVLPRGTRPLIGRVELGQSGSNVIALSASAADQTSGSLEEQGHGLFTYYLLNGLNGAAADGAGRVTAKSLHEYISPKVRDAAKRANRDQAPQLFPPSLAGDADMLIR
jgi:hypothetical protein